jgi:hypothetical protein
MTDAEHLAALIGETADFERVVALQRRGRIEFWIQFINALDTSRLPNAEKERRLAIVLSRGSFSAEDLRSIALAGATIKSAILRNAISALVPAEYRRLVHRATSTEVSGPLPPTPRSKVRSPIVTSEGAGYSIVAILSATTDPAVRALLEGSGFEPLRFDSVTAFDELLCVTPDICAFLIESSFLEGLDEAAQRTLFRRIGEYSTFAVVRCQDAGLRISHNEVGHIIAHAQCTANLPEFDHLNFADQRILQEADLDFLEAARSRLSFGRIGRFLPEEISATQLRLLGVAMTSYTRRKRFNDRADVSTLTIRFLQGGEAAKVALVRVDELPWPVIVKIDVYDQIKEEALRFRTFVEAHDRELHPEVHLHAGAALIIFDIIAAVTSGTAAPAPSLGSVLNAFWSAEIFGIPCSHDAGSIIDATIDASRRLAVLNKLQCTVSEFDVRANPHIELLKKVESAGFDWGFSREVIALRDRADELLYTNARVAICHGDAHTGNVLIQDHYGHVIDYAYSGPGHPCADLTKLELSIFFQSFHPFGAEGAIIELQRDLTNLANDVQYLLDKHSSLMKSRTNELCLRACIAVRDVMSTVLRAHRLPHEHYWAVKLLQAWQSLQISNLPQSLVRIVIQALSMP